MADSQGEHTPVEQADHWSLPVGDGVVTQLQIDFAFGFTVETWLRFRIETPFRVEENGTITEYEPEDSLSLSPLLGLHQAQVALAHAFKDGRLHVECRDGRTLTVEPHPAYEAFNTSGAWADATSSKLIALPGGGLAEFI